MLEFETKERKLTFAILLITAIMFGSFVLSYARIGGDFVRGKYGGKCYIVGSEHGNIEYPVYYDTVEECLESLKEGIVPFEEVENSTSKEKDSVLP